MTDETQYFWWSDSQAILWKTPPMAEIDGETVPYTMMQVGITRKPGRFTDWRYLGTGKPIKPGTWREGPFGPLKIDRITPV